MPKSRKTGQTGPSLAVQMLSPSSGSTQLPGRQIAGIGWLACSSPVLAVNVHLGDSKLSVAQFGLSQAQIRNLTSRPIEPVAADWPVVANAGFLFRAVTPVLPAGPATLRLVVDTPDGRVTHETPLVIAAMAQEEVAPAAVAAKRTRSEAPLEPVQLVIEFARVSEQGILEVSGWAVALAPIQQILVYAGEHLIGEAQRGSGRPDVAEQHGRYPNASQAGFALYRALSEAELQEKTVFVVILTTLGPRRLYDAPMVRPARVRRPTATRVAELECEELFLSDKGVVAVKGWAVCSSGVVGIAVELLEATVGRTNRIEARPDIANRFPHIRSAERAGFYLVQHLAQPVSGEHVLRITLQGAGGETKTVAQAVPVRPGLPAHFAARLRLGAAPDEPTPSGSAEGEETIRFYLDTPTVRDGAAVETVRGFMTLTGWAFARGKISHVEVFVDGVSQGHAHYGIRREDLQAAFPDHDSLLCGFATMIPPHVLKPGLHQVRMVARSAEGHTREVAFSVRAEKATDGPGPWLLRHKIPLAEITLRRSIIAACGPEPRWAIIISLPDTQTNTLALLSRTLRSLEYHAYPHWAVVVLDPGERGIVAAALSAEHPELSGRVRILTATANTSLAELGGKADLVAVLRPGDRLGEDALLEMSVAAALAPQADFFYCDERRVDPADGDVKAFFKPGWSPELLLSTNYIGQFWAASRRLLRKVGLTAAELVASGAYDAVLRLTEAADRVEHVAKVLTARGRAPDERALDRQALRRALQRRGIRGDVRLGELPGSFRIRRPRSGAPMVSIIIPTIASRGLIKVAIDSIRRHTSWPDHEIICIDNIPDGGTPEQAVWKTWIAENADRTVPIASGFNWSRFNNRGARAAQGDYLLFLNDDIEVLDETWLAQLVEQAQRPEIGVVGPQLVYPDGRVQHSGMFLAEHAARHAFRFYPKAEPGPFGLARMQRDVASVTGACMLMRREVFDQLGGFDERHAVVNNDLDFNLRVGRAGYSVIYTPWVSLIHHEMVSRASLADVHDTAAFRSDWGDVFSKGDPFFNRHLSTGYDDYSPDAEPVHVLNVGHPVVARDALRRILVLKLDHIGDFITSFPALRRIKEKFPEAELTVLVAKASLPLAQLEPAIDKVIEFNFYHARSEKGRRTVSRRELADLQTRLTPERFDLAIDLRRQPDTRLVLQYTGARWLAGFDRGYEHPWLDFTVEFEGDLAKRWKREHVVDSLVHMIDAISAKCETDRDVVRDPEQRVNARRAMGPRLLAAGLAAERLAQPLVCIHTGAGALNKQWPGGYFARLIDLLAGEGMVVAVIGGPDESRFANAMLKRVRRREQVVSLVGKTGLGELPQVLAAANLYVGNDSGPKHIAAALGVPTLGIHSGSVDAGEWGPMGPRTLTIRRDMTCSPCYLARASDCHRGLACLTGISVAQVFQACRELLACSPNVRVNPGIAQRRKGVRVRGPTAPSQM